jgi:hypothetical protein
VHPEYLGAVSGGDLEAMVERMTTGADRRRLRERFTR